MTRLPFRTAALLTLVGSACVCSESVDQAAKQRIFSPEDPPQIISAAREKLSPEALPRDERLRRRVLHMTAAEGVERLGAHTFTAIINFEWTAKGRTTRLTENRTLVSDKGGMSGDFSLLTENSRDQGLEVLRVGGTVYARSRYGKFRQRLRDRGMAERERDEVYGALRDLDLIVGERLKLEPRGSATVEGRAVSKFAVSLGPASRQGLLAEQRELPPMIRAKKGPDASTQRRFAFAEKRAPQSVQGEVWVDVQTGVVMKAQVLAKVTAPAPDGTGGDAQLQLKVETDVKAVGQPPQLKPPEEFLPDTDKPAGIADALDRFGIPRGKPDGGTALPLTPEDDEG